MTYKQIALRDINQKLPQTAYEPLLQCYLHGISPEIDPARRYPALLICPGGGYEFTSDREAEPVALRFFAEGFNVFVLRYSCAPARYPTQLLEAAAAVCYIRTAEECLCSGQVFVCGFSAGGHLACSVSVLWDEPSVSEMLGNTSGNKRPDGMLLCYPVITANEGRHEGSFFNLLGPSHTPELLQKVSLEKAVDDRTPPAFIWHTADDAVVPVRNALTLSQSMTESGIPVELHIFPAGVHGLSMCDASSSSPDAPQFTSAVCAQWIPLALTWLKSRLN